MRNFNDILNMRRVPGVIILDGMGMVLFMNEIASSLMLLVRQKESGPDASGSPTVPEEIRILCLQGATVNEGETLNRSGIFFAEGFPFSLRTFLVSGAADNNGPQHIMVLIEPIVERHQINFDVIQKEYGISKRELEVLKLLCLGLSNREIAQRLFISEYTAKDHVKRILEAFDASSRSEVVGVLIG